MMAVRVDPDDGGELDDDHVRAFLSARSLGELNMRLRRCQRKASARMVEIPDVAQSEAR